MCHPHHGLGAVGDMGGALAAGRWPAGARGAAAAGGGAAVTGGGARVRGCGADGRGCAGAA